MERFDEEGEILKRKASYKDGIKGHNDRSDNNRDAKLYTESRRKWQEFLQGKTTAAELGEYLRENEVGEEDMYGED